MMKSLFLYALSFQFLFMSAQSPPFMVDWQMGQCEGDPFRLPYKYAISGIHSDTKFSYFTFKFVENCHLKPKPEIQISNDSIYIKIDNLVPVIEMAFCDCCYSIQFTVLRNITKKHKFIYEGKEVLNLDLKDPHKKIFEIVKGKKVNQYNKYWQKEGVWIENEETINYHNGLPGNYILKNRSGSVFYQNYLESYWVVKSDTFNRVDKKGRKQGLHVGIYNFMDLRAEYPFSLDSVAFYKDNRKIFGHKKGFSIPCNTNYEKTTFQNYSKIETSQLNTEGSYTFIESEQRFRLRDSTKARFVLDKKVLNKGDTLGFGSKYDFYVLDFKKISIVTPNGQEIELVSYFPVDSFFHKSVTLIGIDTIPEAKTVKIYTNKPNYWLKFGNDPSTSEDDTTDLRTHIFNEKGIYRFKYSDDLCFYEEYKVYFSGR